MKRLVKKSNKSIGELIGDIKINMYTKQTISSLFRSLLETVIESNKQALVIINIQHTQEVQGLLARLKYSNAKVVSYSKIEEFSDDEFILLFLDSFSCAISWKKDNADIFQGFCTFNPSDTKKFIELLQNTSFNKEIEDVLGSIRQDRRHNDNFNSIINKLLESLEDSQRDLICADVTNVTGSQIDSEVESFNTACREIRHELRNPVGVLGLYAKIIQKSVEKLDCDLEVQERLINASNCILNASENFESLLNDFKNYSEGLILDKQVGSLPKEVNKAVALLKPLFEQKNISVTFKETENTELIFDKDKIHQVLINLLKNALEATESGGSVSVLINTDNDLASIEIADTGTGIAEELKDKVFLPYFTSKKEGNGIGLARAKKIVNAHSGELYIKTTSKSGTVFVVELPKLVKED